MRVVFAFNRMKIKIMRIKNLKKFQYPRPNDDGIRRFVPDRKLISFVQELLREHAT